MSGDATLFDRNFLVVEFAAILAGPITTMAFAELGARVVKVENPGTHGDPTRGWKLPAEPRGTDLCAYFSCANWGKESIAIDLTSSAGLAVAHDLAARADIVVASFKPGDDRKLGLDYETLRSHNEKLVYGRITAYGADDPRPGFDAILQAESGFTYINGEPDGPPTKMPVALIDLLAAHQLKEGLLLALLKRERGGGGSLVSVSLLQAGVSALANQATNYLVGGMVPQRMGSEHPNIVPYGSIIACQDGREVVIAAATERQYRELVKAIDLPALADDPDFATGPQRVEHRDTLLQRIRSRCLELPADDLSARLTRAKVPHGFVNDMAAVFAQAGAQDLVMEGERNGTTWRGVRSLALGGDWHAEQAPSPPPHLSEHRTAILSEVLGYDAGRIETLDADGAFGPAPD